MINKLKIILWKLGLTNTNKCPICKDKLKRTGFPDEFGIQRYICLIKNCKFNKNG